MSEVTEVKKPWMVGRVEKGDNGEIYTFPVVIENLGFAIQREADKWIKENIKEGETLVSFRLGKTFKVEVVRKVRTV